MTTKIRKWGNSYAVRLPKEAVHKMGLRDGSQVKIAAEAQDIRITPTASRPTLGELVSRLRPDNRHELLPWDKPAGNEVW